MKQSLTLHSLTRTRLSRTRTSSLAPLPIGLLLKAIFKARGRIRRWVPALTTCERRSFLHRTHYAPTQLLSWVNATKVSYRKTSLGHRNTSIKELQLTVVKPPSRPSSGTLTSKPLVALRNASVNLTIRLTSQAQASTRPQRINEWRQTILKDESRGKTSMSSLQVAQMLYSSRRQFATLKTK